MIKKMGAAFVLLVFCIKIFSASTADPLATHTMAVVIGEDELLRKNPATGFLENSGLCTRLADLLGQPDRTYVLTTSMLFRKMIVLYPDLDLDVWKCKSVSDYLYIFIPRGWINDATFDQPLDEPKDKDDFVLGIKVSGMATISSDELMSPTFHKIPLKNRLEESNHIAKVLWDGKKSLLFLTKDEYLAAGMKTFPRWGFIWLGDGTQSTSVAKADGRIVGMTIPDFRGLIPFFDSNLWVSFFLMVGSYAADINLATLFFDGKRLKIPSFMFVSSTVTAAPLLSGRGVNDSRPYKDFFKLLQSAWIPRNGDDVAKAVNTISWPYKIVDKFGVHETTPVAIPIIKMPKEPLFKPARFDGRVVIISNELVRSWQVTTPLFLSAISGEKEYKTPDIVLLNVRNITRPIILELRDEGKSPLFISVVTGPATHVFDEIDARTMFLSDVLKAFISVPFLQEDRVFLIKKLHVRNDLNKFGATDKMYQPNTFYEVKIVHMRPERTGLGVQQIIYITKYVDDKKTVSIEARGGEVFSWNWNFVPLDNVNLNTIISSLTTAPLPKEYALFS